MQTLTSERLAHRSGTPFKPLSGSFRLERDMFAIVCDLLPQIIFPDPAHFVVLREPTVGSVIPDLLFAQWSEDFRSPKKNFTFVEAQILALLEKHDELLASDIPQLLHLSTPAAAKALKRIQQSGLVVPTTSGKISLDAGSFTRGMEVTAVELKLCRWRDAVKQAASYLRFANRSYVVLDAERFADAEELLRAARTVGVGLLMLGANELTKLADAPVYQCISPQRVKAVQKLATHSARLGKLQTCVGAPRLEGL